MTAKIGVSARPTASSSTTARVIGSPFAHVASFWISEERSPTSSPTASTSARQASRSAVAPSRANCSPTHSGSSFFATSYACDLAGLAHRLRERGVLLEPVADEHEDGVGSRRGEVRLDLLDVGGLPRLDAVDDDGAGLAAEEAERVAGGDGVGAGRLRRVEALRRVLTDARPEPLQGERDLRPVAPREEVDRLQRALVRHAAKHRRLPRPRPGRARRPTRLDVICAPGRLPNAARARGDEPRAPAVEPRQRGRDRRRDRRDRRRQEREAEHLDDDRNRDDVRRDGDERDLVELQPRHRRRREPARRRDADQLRELVRDRVALERADDARRDDEDRGDRGERELEAGVEERVRVPREENRCADEQRLPAVALRAPRATRASRAPRRCRRARPTDGGRPRARTPRRRRAPRPRRDVDRGPRGARSRLPPARPSRPSARRRRDSGTAPTRGSRRAATGPDEVRPSEDDRLDRHRAARRSDPARCRPRATARRGRRPRRSRRVVRRPATAPSRAARRGFPAAAATSPGRSRSTDRSGREAAPSSADVGSLRRRAAERQLEVDRLARPERPPAEHDAPSRALVEAARPSAARRPRRPPARPCRCGRRARCGRARRAGRFPTPTRPSDDRRREHRRANRELGERRARARRRAPAASASAKHRRARRVRERAADADAPTTTCGSRRSRHGITRPFSCAMCAGPMPGTPSSSATAWNAPCCCR